MAFATPLLVPKNEIARGNEYNSYSNIPRRIFGLLDLGFVASHQLPLPRDNDDGIRCRVVGHRDL